MSRRQGVGSAPKYPTKCLQGERLNGEIYLTPPLTDTVFAY